MRRIQWTIVGLVVLAATSMVLAQTPANDGVCDGLAGGTPGLYGLCVAFCEAHDCEPDLTAVNPWADCTPADSRLLEIYDQLKQPGDPDMPCVQTESACPCFTQEQLDGIPTPYSQCIIDYSFGSTDELTTDFLYEQGTGAQAVLSPYTNSCVYADGLVDPPIFIYMETTRAQAEDCRQMIVDTIENNIDQCELLCDPVCNN